MGTVAVTVVFGLLVASWLAMGTWPRAELARNVFLAGFVGGFTNSVAIRMLFTRYWFLPGSGVLLKERDAIIASLADTLEAHILNPGLIESRVRQLSRELDRERVAAMVNSVLDAARRDLVDYVRAPEQREHIVRALRNEAGFWGSVANSLGIVTYELAADRLTAGLARRIEAFQVTADMVGLSLAKAGSLDEILLHPGNRFVRKHYGTEKSLAQVLFQALDAKQLVVDRLSTYDAAQIRDLIADNIRQHLAWLEVFGVLLGLVFALLAAAVDALV